MSTSRIRIWSNPAPGTSITDVALSKVENYTNPSDDRPRLNALRRDILAHAGNARIEAEQRVASALASSWNAAELIEAVYALDDTTRRMHLLDTTVEQLDTRHRLAREFRHVDDEDTAPALLWLHEQLEALLATVRDLEPTLAGIETPDEALTGTDEQIIAWRTLTDACATYNEIRSAQTRITALALSRRDDPTRKDDLDRYGVLRDTFALEPFDTADRLRAAGRDGDTHTKPIYAWLATFPPFPTITRDPRNRWPDDDDQPAHLRWLAQTHAAWVPTVAQLDAVTLATRDILTPIDRWSRILIALAAYEVLYPARKLKAPAKLDVDAIRAEAPKRMADWGAPLARVRHSDDWAAAYLQAREVVGNGFDV